MASTGPRSRAAVEFGGGVRADVWRVVVYILDALEALGSKYHTPNRFQRRRGMSERSAGQTYRW